jgi:hypothetical protein
MELLAAAGDRSGALRQYRVCVGTLERELGSRRSPRRRPDTRPSATPAMLCRHRREGSRYRGRASPSPRRLLRRPAPAPVFRSWAGPPAGGHHPGRDEVARGDGRVVAIVGEPGIGKTRLGDEVAP